MASPSHDLDEFLIAYMIANLKYNRICINCGTKDTPQWRKFPFVSKIGDLNILSCNKCGLKLKKNSDRMCKICGKISDISQTLSLIHI